MNAGFKKGGTLDLSETENWILRSLFILLADSGSDLLIIVKHEESIWHPKSTALALLNFANKKHRGGLFTCVYK